MTASAIVEILSAGGHWDASTDGGTLQFDADGIALNSLNGVDLTATAVDGGSVQLISTDNDVELNADKTVLIEGDATPGTSEVIRVTLGGKTWEFRSNGDVHIPTGASVIADT